MPLCTDARTRVQGPSARCLVWRGTILKPSVGYSDTERRSIEYLRVRAMYACIVWARRSPDYRFAL